LTCTGEADTGNPTPAQASLLRIRQPDPGSRFFQWLEKVAVNFPMAGMPSRSPMVMPAFVTSGDYGVAAFAPATKKAKAGNFAF